VATSGDRSKGTFTGLLNAEERHRAYPSTFSIPRSDLRRSLTVGSFAKLLFGVGYDDSTSAERMWVEVTEVGANGYVGRLDNDPTLIADLAPDQLVPFGPEHIAAIDRPDLPFAVRTEQFAVVSDQIMEGGKPPVRASRVEVPDEQFSGWFVFADGDPVLPPKDMAGFYPISHYALGEKWRSFESVEDEPPGTEWVWDPATVEWVRTPRRSR
jgi:hypothetical protein